MTMQLITESTLFSPESIERIEKHYDAKYVCETGVKQDGGWRWPAAVFYQPDREKVPPGGTQWFGLFWALKDHLDPHGESRPVICNAISALEPFTGVVADNGDIIWSCYRHDYHTSPDGSVWIDGGRDYVRCPVNAKLVTLAIEKDQVVILEYHNEEKKVLDRAL